MNNNGCVGQLIGPFNANEELYRKIQEQCIDNISCVKHIGIQIDDYQNQQVMDRHPIIYINNQKFEIGKNGIYEIDDVEITSIYFPEDKNDNTIIDYVVEIKTERPF